MTKIILRLEKDGKYIEKRLTRRMVCALFDLQFMINGIWKTIKLNKMDKDLIKLFKIVSHIDDAMHGNKTGTYDKKKKKVIWTDKHKGEWLFGKPKWKKIE